MNASEYVFRSECESLAFLLPDGLQPGDVMIGYTFGVSIILDSSGLDKGGLVFFAEVTSSAQIAGMLLGDRARLNRGVSDRMAIPASGL